MRTKEEMHEDESRVKKFNTEYDAFNTPYNSTTPTHASKERNPILRNILHLKKACSLSSVASLSPDPSLSRGSLISSLRNRFFAS
jgi:hypothetical protein